MFLFLKSSEQVNLIDYVDILKKSVSAGFFHRNYGFQKYLSCLQNKKSDETSTMKCVKLVGYRPTKDISIDFKATKFNKV